MTHQKPELMPCPFCGETDIEKNLREFDSSWRCYIFCGGCDLEIASHAQIRAEAEHQAEKKWNTRASTDLYTAACAERDALRELCEWMAKAIEDLLNTNSYWYMEAQDSADDLQTALTAYKKHKAGE